VLLNLKLETWNKRVLSTTSKNKQPNACQNFCFH